MSIKELYEVEYNTMGNPGSPIYFYGSFTENEMLSPHNRDVADSEIVEVLPWDRFVFMASSLMDGRIEIVEEVTE